MNDARMNEARKQPGQRRYHQVATVRRREGIAKRTAANKLNVSVRRISELEDETVDLPISMLCRWAVALKVPVSELLLSRDGETPEPLWKRSQLVQMMKSVESIRRDSYDASAVRLANNLRKLLLKIMPELVEIAPWPKQGAARQADRGVRFGLPIFPASLLDDAM